ncbi:MAG: hypothetical protein E7039_11595 [Lentisphaerae bacterium]|nr:hypothetical protein [Lentisphaerota bacterium]
MSIIKCKECGKDISDAAESCPGCGCPVKENKHKKIGSFIFDIALLSLFLLGFYYSYVSPNTQAERLSDVCKRDEARGIKFSDNYRTLKEYPSYLSETSYSIPNGVVEIGERAFSSRYHLQSVIIPDSVIKIGDSAFAFCYDLQKVTIGSNVTEIGWDAFYGCKNLHVTIPANIKRIGERAFVDVKSVKVSTGNNDFYTDRYGALITVDYKEILYFPPSFSGHYEIPGDVTSIKWKAFAWCNLSGITIPDSVRSIGSAAFYGCRNLTEVHIPRNCDIARDAFPVTCKIIRR